ncbi:MAG: helix-turn-helix transcriptional regulator [Micromonosporaceae bacterium]
MAVGSPPTVRRRQLGRELRKLREEAGLHIDDVAEQLRCSPSRVSRIETARIRIAPGTVHEILDVLDIHDDRRARLVSLARQAEEPGWWQEYTDVLTYEYSTYIALEAEASTLHAFEPLVIHGLLQTEEYARAVISKHYAGDAAEVEPRVKARLARQEALRRDEPLRLWVLIGEAALRQQVGGPKVMRAQLRRLIEVARLPHVRLQILPFSVGALTWMTGPFSILDFPDPDVPTVVYVESLAGDTYIESPHGVEGCTKVFDGLAADALDVSDSLAMLETLSRTVPDA